MTHIAIQLDNNSPRLRKKNEQQQQQRQQQYEQLPHSGTPPSVVKVEEKHIPKLKPESVHHPRPPFSDRPKERPPPPPSASPSRGRAKERESGDKGRNSSTSWRSPSVERQKEKPRFATVTPPKSILKPTQGYVSGTDDDNYDPGPQYILPRRKRTDSGLTTSSATSYDEEIIKTLVTEKVLSEKKAKKSPAAAAAELRSIPKALQVNNNNNNSNNNQKPPLPSSKATAADYYASFKSRPAEFTPKSRNFFDPPKSPVVIKPCPNPLRPLPRHADDLEVEAATLRTNSATSIRSQSSLASLISSDRSKDPEFSVTIRSKKPPSSSAYNTDEDCNKSNYSNSSADDFALPVANRQPNNNRRKSIGDRIQSWNEKVNTEESQKSRQISLDYVKERNKCFASLDRKSRQELGFDVDPSYDYSSAASSSSVDQRPPTVRKKLSLQHSLSLEQIPDEEKNRPADDSNATLPAELEPENSTVTKAPLKSILKPPSPCSSPIPTGSSRDGLLFLDTAGLSSDQHYKSVYKSRESPSFTTWNKNPYSRLLVGSAAGLDAKQRYNSLPQLKRTAAERSERATSKAGDLTAEVKSSSLPRLSKEKDDITTNPGTEKRHQTPHEVKDQSSSALDDFQTPKQQNSSTDYKARYPLQRPTSFTEFYDKNISLCVKTSKPYRHEETEAVLVKSPASPLQPERAGSLPRSLNLSDFSSSSSSRQDLNLFSPTSTSLITATPPVITQPPLSVSSASKLVRPSQFYQPSSDQRLLSPAPYRAPSPLPPSPTTTVTPAAVSRPSSPPPPPPPTAAAASDYHNKAADASQAVTQAAAYTTLARVGADTTTTTTTPLSRNRDQAGEERWSRISASGSSSSNSIWPAPPPPLPAAAAETHSRQAAPPAAAIEAKAKVAHAEYVHAAAGEGRSGGGGEPGRQKNSLRDDDRGIEAAVRSEQKRQKKEKERRSESCWKEEHQSSSSRRSNRRSSRAAADEEDDDQRQEQQDNVIIVSADGGGKSPRKKKSVQQEKEDSVSTSGKTD